MKKKLKIICVISLLLLLIGSCVFADNYELPSEIKHDENNKADISIRNGAGIILGVFQIIGVAAALVMLVMLAIKYMAASPSEKANITKSAIAYIIGAILLFGTSAVLKIIEQFASDIF